MSGKTARKPPPAETFEFEVEDTAKGEKHPLSYYGIGVEDLKLSTNGVNDVEKTLRFHVKTKKDYPAEALSEPIFRTWHFFWRVKNKK